MSAIATMKVLVEVHKQEHHATASRTSTKIASFPASLSPSLASSNHATTSSPSSSCYSSARSSPTSSRTSSPAPLHRHDSHIVAPVATAFTSPIYLPSPPPSVTSSSSSSTSDPSEMLVEDGEQPLNFTILSPLFFEQKMWLLHSIRDVYLSLARSVDRHPFALLMFQYSIALVHGMTVYLLSVLLSLAHLLVIAATMDSLGWKSGIKRLRSEWDIRLPKMLDFEPCLQDANQRQEKLRSHRLLCMPIVAGDRASTSTTSQATAMSETGWNASLRYRLTQWNQWAVPWIWSQVPMVQESNTQEVEEMVSGDTVSTSFAEGVGHAADESYPSRLRKAFVRTLSGGFRPAATTASNRKKVTFSEQVVIWGRRRSSVAASPSPISTFSQDSLTTEGDAQPVSSQRHLAKEAGPAPAPPPVSVSGSPSSTSTTMSSATMLSSDSSIAALQQQQQQPLWHAVDGLGITVTSTIPCSKACNSIDWMVKEETEFQRRSEDSNGSGTPSQTMLTVSTPVTTSTSLPTAPYSAPAPAIPSTCRKVAAALIPNRKSTTDNSNGRDSSQHRQEQSVPVVVPQPQQQLASQQSLRRSASVPMKLGSLLQRHSQDDNTLKDRRAVNASESVAPVPGAGEISRPDSRASTVSTQSSSARPASPLPSPTKSVEFVAPATSASGAASGATGRISISLGARAKRSLSLVLPGHSHADKLQQQSQQSSAGNISGTSTGSERQTSHKKNNFMYRIVHPQRYKRELEQQQQEQDRERLRFLVRLQHHQLMNEGQNGFPACPDTMKWMLQIESRTKQQQQLLYQDPMVKESAAAAVAAAADNDGTTMMDASLSSLWKENIRKVNKKASMESEDPFFHTHYTLPTSAEYVTDLGAPGSMISTSVGTHFPIELQQKPSDGGSGNGHGNKQQHQVSRPRPMSFDRMEDHRPVDPTFSSENAQRITNSNNIGFRLFRKQTHQEQPSISSLSSTDSATDSSVSNNGNNLPRRLHQLFHPGHEQTQSTSSLIDPKWTQISRTSSDPVSASSTSKISSSPLPATAPSSSSSADTGSHSLLTRARSSSRSFTNTFNTIVGSHRQRSGNTASTLSSMASSKVDSPIPSTPSLPLQTPADSRAVSPVESSDERAAIASTQPAQDLYLDENPCRLVSAKPKVEDQTSFAAFGFPSPTHTPSPSKPGSPRSSMSSATPFVSSTLPSRLQSIPAVLKSSLSASDLRRRASLETTTASGSIWRSRPRSEVVEGRMLEVLDDEYGSDYMNNNNSHAKTVSRRSSLTFPLPPSPVPSPPMTRKENMGKVLMRKLTPRKKKT